MPTEALLQTRGKEMSLEGWACPGRLYGEPGRVEEVWRGRACLWKLCFKWRGESRVKWGKTRPRMIYFEPDRERAKARGVGHARTALAGSQKARVHSGGDGHI